LGEEGEEGEEGGEGGEGEEAIKLLINLSKLILGVRRNG
jgi:hypothetical protein